MVAGAQRFRGFTLGDSLRLLVCVGSAWAGSFTLLSLGMPQMLQTTTQAISLSLARQALQLEGKRAGLHEGRALRVWAAVNPPPQSLPAADAQAAALRRNLQEAGLSGDLRRDPPSQRSWLGGYWLAVQRSTPASQQLWVYASPGTALPWLWPAIRIGSLLLGGSSGVALFLQWQLQRPIQQLLKQLPAIPSGELELVPEAGMGAMRELSIRINRVLEQLNQQHESRRRFLQGLAHDLGSPLTRLSMRVERLEDQPADPSTWAEALPQLRVEIDRLSTLTHLLQEAAGEQTEPFRPRLSALDELCERVVASYPQQPIELAVPRLLVRLDQALIERALQNLIDNAIRYGRAPIRLAAQQQRASVVLMVEDSGPGLTAPICSGCQESLPPTIASNATAPGWGSRSWSAAASCMAAAWRSTAPA